MEFQEAVHEETRKKNQKTHFYFIFIVGKINILIKT